MSKIPKIEGGARLRDLRVRLGAVDYMPDPRDYQVALLTPNILEQIPEQEVRLLDYMLDDTGRSQGNIGSCVGWDGSFAVEAAMAIIMKLSLSWSNINDLSAGWAYQKSREHAGIPLPSEGSTNFGLVKALHKEGICVESLCPTDIKAPFNFEPKEGAVEDAAGRRAEAYYRVPTTPAAMQAALLGLTHDPGYKMPDGSVGLCPLITSFKVYKNAWLPAYEDGFVSIPEPNDVLLGGHSSLVIGWIVVEGVTYWVNYGSWGEDRGGELPDATGEPIRGLFFIPVGYPFYDAWVLQYGEVAPPPAPDSLWCKIGDFFHNLGGCKQAEVR